MKRTDTVKFDDSEAWKLWSARDESAAPILDEKGPWVDSTKFNLGIGVIIILNALSIGVETELCGGSRGDCKGSVGWAVIEWIFSICWVLEMGARVSVHRLAYFNDAWALMDFALVALAVADTWVLPYMGSSQDVRMFSVLRLLRLLRLVRVVRLLRIFKELWLLVNGFIDSLRVLGWLGVLLLLILYCGAIITTMVIGDACDDVKEDFQDCEMMFNGVFASMFTLFQVLTLESWSMSVARPVMRHWPAFFLFFIGFLFLTSFGLMNIVIGVIVENTLIAAEQNEDKVRKLEEQERASVLQALQSIFVEADVDKDGFVSREEFHIVMERPEVKDKMEVLELQSQEAEELFSILDTTKQGELDIDEFISGILRLKGAARAKDLMGVVVSQRSLARKMDELRDLPGKVDGLGLRMERLELLLSRVLDSGPGGGTGEVPPGGLGVPQPGGNPPSLNVNPRAPAFLPNPPGCVTEEF